MVTILWIEDETYHLQALPKLLAMRRIDTIKARTKSEAIEALKNNSEYDLVLLDIILPQDTRDILQDNTEPFDDLVGLSILRKLMHENYSVPIFVFSIVNDHDVINEIENYGVRYYYKGSTKLTDLCNDIITATGG